MVVNAADVDSPFACTDLDDEGTESSDAPFVTELQLLYAVDVDVEVAGIAMSDFDIFLEGWTKAVQAETGGEDDSNLPIWENMETPNSLSTRERLRARATSTSSSSLGFFGVSYSIRAGIPPC